ncbi:rhamnogalacturonan lyase [Salibacterium halotolerans]|uniref:Uncharacterized protein n=1 Tax=Salibacterium halotolerans TaxID=1884432 RepID=A0A1I5W7R8_9BACI|nr:rhamnogalacturonan lyase [Salibacterium halotolerans]SFQ15703.1 hypothetical protein SAMN05518683_11925 [Salibacterium halotolerans]
MKKFPVMLTAALICAWTVPHAPTAASNAAAAEQAPVQLENLDRGLKAVNVADGVFLGWRLLAGEVTGHSDTGLTGANFHVYRNGEKIAEVENSTNYLDEDGEVDDEYVVKAVTDGSVESTSKTVTPWAENYYELPLQKPDDGVTPAGETYTYHANDMSVGDVTGDGRYEYVVKWDPDNSKDVSQNGYTGNTYIDTYTYDGELLYRIDLGRNIRSGAHYTQFLVSDFDNSGKAELMFKTAPGTKVIHYDENGDVESEEYITMPKEDKEAGYSHSDDYRMSSEDYYNHIVEMFMGWHEHEEVVNGSWPETLEESFGIEPRYEYPLSREDAESLADYFMDEYAPSRSDRNNLRELEGFILEGPEYLTVFNGETGEEMDTVDYKPARHDDGLMWGDYAMSRIEPGNRVDRLLAGTAYLDGKKPYAVFARGYYTRTSLVSYSWNGEELREHWYVDSGWTPMDNPFNDSPHGTPGTNEEFSSITSQGNHSFSTADVDEDGKHEIIYGSATIDHDGSLLYSSFDTLPEESADPGANVRFGHGDAMHVADIDPDREGLEIFTVHEPGAYAPYGYVLRDAENGEVIYGEYTGEDTGRGMIGDVNPEYEGLETWAEGLWTADGRRISEDMPGTNMNIKWSADMTTQIIDGAIEETPVINDWQEGTVLTAEGTRTNNYTKGNPSLVADVFGDWREEMLVRTTDSSAIRMYMNTEVTDHKLYTLMHDPQYRTGISWQNSGYNQPAYPSFYFGSDMNWADVPVPDVQPDNPLEQLEDTFRTYIQEGKINKPMQQKLGNQLRQAKHHAEKENIKQARHFMYKFTSQLMAPNNENHISEEAADELRQQAMSVIRSWEDQL